MTEGRVPGWAASFGMANQVGLGIGQTFVNPLHLWHESGSEVLFAPLCPAQAVPSNVVDDLWVSSWPAAAAAGHAVEYLGHPGCDCGLEGLTAAYNGAPG